MMHFIIIIIIIIIIILMHAFTHACILIFLIRQLLYPVFLFESFDKSRFPKRVVY